MIASQGRPRKRVRSIFVSDIHLGCRWSQADQVLEFLEQHQPDFLYLVGDIVDGWRLSRVWHWRPVYNAILRRLIEMSGSGTRVCYAPGNHDAFMREFLHDFRLVHVADQFVHEGADGKRYLVLHGDQFDDFEARAPWLSWIGSLAYDGLMRVERVVNGVRATFGGERWPICAFAKRKVKGAVTFLSRFEARLADHARVRRCEGVICGHVHTPTDSLHADVRYLNTGDWVENRTALVEHFDGSMQIVSVDHDGIFSGENRRISGYAASGIQDLGGESEEPSKDELEAIESVTV
jgi:UDP-2,3-diacylglucosamine pyrophosphatase LpxH